MAKNHAGGIVALQAEAQQTLAAPACKVGLATKRVIASLRIGDVKELGGRAELLPQLSCTGAGVAGFRHYVAFDNDQGRTQGTPKLKLLAPAFYGIR